MNTLGDTVSMILKERCVELRRCGGRYTGDHMFTEIPQNLQSTFTIKIKFCAVHLTDMQEGLTRYKFYLLRLKHQPNK